MRQHTRRWLWKRGVGSEEERRYPDAQSQHQHSTISTFALFVKRPSHVNPLHHLNTRKHGPFLYHRAVWRVFCPLIRSRCSLKAGDSTVKRKKILHTKKRKKKKKKKTNQLPPHTNCKKQKKKIKTKKRKKKKGKRLRTI